MVGFPLRYRQTGRGVWVTVLDVMKEQRRRRRRRGSKVTVFNSEGLPKNQMTCLLLLANILHFFPPNFMKLIIDIQNINNNNNKRQYLVPAQQQRSVWCSDMEIKNKIQPFRCCWWFSLHWRFLHFPQCCLAQMKVKEIKKCHIFVPCGGKQKLLRCEVEQKQSEKSAL